MFSFSTADFSFLAAIGALSYGTLRLVPQLFALYEYNLAGAYARVEMLHNLTKELDRACTLLDTISTVELMSTQVIPCLMSSLYRLGFSTKCLFLVFVTSMIIISFL